MTITIEEAINNLESLYNEVYNEDSDGYVYAEAIDMAIEVLTDKPQGKWIMHIDDLFPEESTQECSNCHEHENIKICNDNYCPNCGADMRGEKK